METLAAADQSVSCTVHGISLSTGYNWIKAYKEEGRSEPLPRGWYYFCSFTCPIFLSLPALPLTSALPALIDTGGRDPWVYTGDNLEFFSEFISGLAQTCPAV